MWTGFQCPSGLFSYSAAGKHPVVFLHGNIAPAFYLPFLPCGDIHWYVPIQSGSYWKDQKVAFNKASLHTCIHELKAFLDELPEKKFHLMGHSWGAQLALCYAAQFPETLKAVTLLAPGPCSDDMKRIYKERLQARIPEEERRHWDECNHRVKSFLHHTTELSAETIKHYVYFSSLISCETESGRSLYQKHLLLHGGPAAFASGASEVEVIKAVASMEDPEVPIHILYGREDYEPIEQSAWLAGKFKVVSETFFDSCGHYPMIDAPDKFSDYISTQAQKASIA